MTAPSIREAVARAMCFQDARNHTWHCNPDALAEPAHWGRGESGNLDRRLTNWEVRAYLADAALAVALPILRSHYAKMVDDAYYSGAMPYALVSSAIRADEGPK